MPMKALSKRRRDLYHRSEDGGQAFADWNSKTLTPEQAEYISNRNR